MDPTEKILVRLTPDTMLLLQELVDRGDYDSLAEGVADAISKLVESKFTPEESAKYAKRHVLEKPLNMKALITDGEKESMDEAVRKAVRGYVRTRMGPEE
jgi:Arc/MetJ-type ribon-helix-helix transcriptional regulator